MSLGWSADDWAQFLIRARRRNDEFFLNGRLGSAGRDIYKKCHDAKQPSANM